MNLLSGHKAARREPAIRPRSAVCRLLHDDVGHFAGRCMSGVDNQAVIAPVAGVDGVEAEKSFLLQPLALSVIRDGSLRRSVVFVAAAGRIDSLRADHRLYHQIHLKGIGKEMPGEARIDNQRLWRLVQAGQIAIDFAVDFLVRFGVFVKFENRHSFFRSHAAQNHAGGNDLPIRASADFIANFRFSAADLASDRDEERAVFATRTWRFVHFDAWPDVWADACSGALACARFTSHTPAKITAMPIASRAVNASR